MKNRAIGSWLKKHAKTPRGRMVVLTGARQTGKTTLVRQLFKEYDYISLDDPMLRMQLRFLSARDWSVRHRKLILDEVQKMPELMDTVKAIYDMDSTFRCILLGSSQILLLERVKETLAGRVSRAELMPLTLPEVATDGWECAVKESRLLRFFRSCDVSELLKEAPAQSQTFAQDKMNWERMLQMGSMPYIWQDVSEADSDMWGWLLDYVVTYLQRDVRDVAAIRDLEPFVRAQQAIAGLSGQCMNASEIARTAAISPATAQRFIRYLEMSYQAIQLPPWYRNLSKRLAKAPKVHIADCGILRAILRQKEGALTGHSFESAVVAEIDRQIRGARMNASLYHLRTVDGREVDLLIELEDGYIAIEIKQGTRAHRVDARHLMGLSEILDKPLLAGFVLSNDPIIQSISPTISAVPVAFLLGVAAD